MSQGSRCAAERRSESPSAQTISIDMFLHSSVVRAAGVAAMSQERARIFLCSSQVKSSQALFSLDIET
jgi:hypothetical protein